MDNLQWKREYGWCAAALAEDHELPGAASMFDQALTNGLLAIVAYEWPGHENDGRQMRSAGKLLDVVSNHATEVESGVYQVSTRATGYVPRDSRPRGFVNLTTPSHEFVRIKVGLLMEALYDVTQPVRHGRPGGGAPEERHVDALLELDYHPALGSLSEGYGDRAYRNERIHDLWAWNNAEQYLSMIGEDEAERRVAMATNYLPLDLKERLTGPSLYECPVCWNESLLGYEDSMANGVGVGRCVVCSYERSKAIAEDEALTVEWKLRWRDA